MIGSAARTAARPQKQNSKVFRFRAPTSGMDVRKSLGDFDSPLNSVYSYNLLPREQGLQVREGYREWNIGVNYGGNEGIHTLIPFNSVNADPADDRLFAVNNEGIWDVTDYNTTPTLVATFPDQDADAGYGTFTHYVNQAEADVLFYADNLNGLWEYTQSTDTWAVPAAITGITVADINFVTIHKNHVWFAVKDSTVGYYLPILASAGAATKAFFGDKFKHGGALVGLFSWTVDGGDGVDDILIVVSKAGDVIMYTGSGPDQTDWGMKGVWYIGKIPNTPRFGSEQGGELYLLSAYGIVSMNDLLQGVDTAALSADLEGTGMAYKVAGLLRNEMKNKIDDRGWDVALIPVDGGLLVSTPTAGSEAAIQYYFNLATSGWGLWRDVPMTCFSEYKDSVYFGTADGRVMKMDVTVDNALIAPPEPLFNGEDIQFSILTAYSPLGAEGVYKRSKLIRPDFLSTVPPSHSSQARYDFDVTEALNTNFPEPLLYPVGHWDVNNWDDAVWGSTTPQTFPTIGGAWGLGRYIAIATRGAARSRTRLIGWDLIYDIGGPMI